VILEVVEVVAWAAVVADAEPVKPLAIALICRKVIVAAERRY